VFALFGIEILSRFYYNRHQTEIRRAGVKRGASTMISYKKLWHVLLDKDLKKKDLATLAGVSAYAINKLAHGNSVTTDVMQRICKALECDIGDIMEVLPDEPNKRISGWTTN
jgi:DNA-binding Xre family transcriptional regulator